MEPQDLRRIREGMNWTQTEAAEKVGVERNTWARWERGEVAPHPLREPHLQRLLRQAARRAEKRVARVRARVEVETGSTAVPEAG